MAKLLAWKHPGFSAHVGEPIAPEEKQHLEDTAAYLVRNPLSLKKLVYLGVIAMKVFGQDQLLTAAAPEKLLCYALSLPVSLATVGMPRPELLDRNATRARSFAPLGDGEMRSLRAAVGDSKRRQLAQFLAHHRDVWRSYRGGLDPGAADSSPIWRSALARSWAFAASSAFLSRGSTSSTLR